VTGGVKDAVLRGDTCIQMGIFLRDTGSVFRSSKLPIFELFARLHLVRMCFRLYRFGFRLTSPVVRYDEQRIMGGSTNDIHTYTQCELCLDTAQDIQPQATLRFLLGYRSWLALGAAGIRHRSGEWVAPISPSELKLNSSSPPKSTQILSKPLKSTHSAQIRSILCRSVAMNASLATIHSHA
jgi:hypothetical protein